MVSVSGVMASPFSRRAIEYFLNDLQFTLEAGDLTIEHPDYLAINIVWLGGSGLCDMIITVTLVVLVSSIRHITSCVLMGDNSYIELLQMSDALRQSLSWAKSL